MSYLSNLQTVKKVLLTASGIVACLLLFNTDALSQDQGLGLSGSWDFESRALDLEWTELPDSSGTVTYTVKRDFGYTGIPEDVVTVLMEETSHRVTGSGVRSIPIVYEEDNYGTHRYRVEAVDEGGKTAVSCTFRNPFMYYNYAEFDDDGEYWGFGQKWYIPFNVQYYGQVRAEIYCGHEVKDFRRTSVTDGTTRDEHGFYINPKEEGIEPLRTFEKDTYWPRDMGQTIDLEWDWKDDDGNLLPPGEYDVFFEAYRLGEKRDTGFRPIVIPDPRYAEVVASGILGETGISDISFRTNHDSEIKILICEPGTEFIEADSGGILQYLDEEYTYYEGYPLPVDGDDEDRGVDSGRILSVVDAWKPAGNVAVQWDGRDDAGDLVEGGVYEIAITGRNSFGDRIEKNHTTSLAVDRDYEREDPDDPEPEEGEPEIVATFPSNGSLHEEPVYEVTVELKDDFGIDDEETEIKLRDPNLVEYEITDSDVDVSSMNPTYVKEFEDGLRANGSYRLSISAVNVEGNDTEREYYFRIDIPDILPEEEDPQDVLDDSLKAYPQPASGGIIKIAFDEPFDGEYSVDLEVFNIMQEEVHSDSRNIGNGEKGEEKEIFTWNFDGQPPGVYFYRVTVENSDESVDSIERLVIVE